MADAAPDVKPAADGLANLGCWIAGCVMIYMALFGLGKVLFHETALGLGMLTLAAAAGDAVRKCQQQKFLGIFDF